MKDVRNVAVQNYWIIFEMSGRFCNTINAGTILTHNWFSLDLALLLEGKVLCQVPAFVVSSQKE